MPQSPTMLIAVRANTCPRWRRNLPRTRLIATPFRLPPAAAQASFPCLSEHGGGTGRWQSLVWVVEVPRTEELAQIGSAVVSSTCLLLREVRMRKLRLVVAALCV